MMSYYNVQMCAVVQLLIGTDKAKEEVLIQNNENVKIFSYCIITVIIIITVQHQFYGTAGVQGVWSHERVSRTAAFYHRFGSNILIFNVTSNQSTTLPLCSFLLKNKITD